MDYEVDTSNVVNGMDVPNQKAFAAILNEEYKDSTNSRKAQRERWGRYMTWERDGYSFLNIWKKERPDPKPLSKTDVYGPLVLTILKSYFGASVGKKEHFSTTKLMRLCGVVNENYGSNIAQEMSKKWGFSYKQATYFLNTLINNTNQLFSSHVEEPLKRLDGYGYLTWEKPLYVQKPGKVFRRAAEEEETLYNKVINDFKKEKNIQHISWVYNGTEVRRRLLRAGFEDARQVHEIMLLTQAEDTATLWENRLNAVAEINARCLEQMEKRIEPEINRGVDSYLLAENGPEAMNRAVVVGLNNDKPRMRKEKHDLIGRLIYVDLREYERKYKPEM